MMTNQVPPWLGFLTADQEALQRSNLAPGRWRVPVGIGVAEGRLHYPTDAFTMIGAADSAYREAGSHGLRVLTEFVGLVEASDQQIEAYARKFGVLGICAHGFPPTSCPQAAYRQEWHARFCPPQGYPWRCSEPLTTWRSLAAWTRAMLNAMALLHRKQSVALADWEILTEGGKRIRELPNSMSRREQWAFVLTLLSGWLEVISFRPGLRISPNQKVEFALTISRHDFSQLLAVLGLELLFQVTRAKRLLTCSSCGSPYTPKRLPTTGKGTYCPNCRRAAGRDAATRWRKNNPDYFRRRRAEKKKGAG